MTERLRQELSSVCCTVRDSLCMENSGRANRELHNFNSYFSRCCLHLRQSRYARDRGTGMPDFDWLRVCAWLCHAEFWRD